jgi:hypothetical protein
LTACTSFEEQQASQKVSTALRCPALASDIRAEAKRDASVDAETWEEIAAKLKLQTKAKNRALKRAVAAYDSCRKT